MLELNEQQRVRLNGPYPLMVSCPSHMSGLVDAGVRTWVDVDATDYDHRDADDGGCDPDGCVPENTRDGSRAANSRWSCQGDGCCITYSFEEPQDIVRMRIAFHKGDERIRTLNVYDNGDHHSEITSSGETSGFENFSLNTDETEDIKLCLDDDGDDWLSITEVRSNRLRNILIMTSWTNSVNVFRIKRMAVIRTTLCSDSILVVIPNFLRLLVDKLPLAICRLSDNYGRE